MKCDKKDLLLYAVTDRYWLKNETLVSQVEKALKGGTTFVQLREKELGEAAFLEEAREIKALCEKYHVPFVINDNVEIALQADTDGVHVGQSDMEAGNVRELIGMDKILGVSVQTVDQALLAEKQGADYLGVGAVFPTGSKTDAEDVSFEMLKQICSAVSIPVIAIGGIGKDNVMKLADSGICGIAVISAIFGQKDIEAATAELKTLTEKMLCNTVRGAIFDLDGTILDSMPIWDQAGELFLRSLGIEAEPELGKILFPMSMEKGAEYLKERYRLERSTGEIMEGINRTIQEFYSCQVPLKDGAEEFLRGLKQAGFKITAATSSDRQVIESALERLGVMDCFERIFTCSEIGAGKTKPDIYFAAADYMQTLPQDTWVLEDALFAIQTAKKAGFRTAGVFDASSSDDQDEIKEVCEIYFKKLDKLNYFFERL